MKIKCIACDALARPVYLSAAFSPHIVDIELVERGLHTYPAVLRQKLQESINSVKTSDYNAIALLYGLCGQATSGLEAKHVPVVIPRAHDCITLFLGSRQSYKYQFENFPGTYWYAQDYIERDNGSGGGLSLGSGNEAVSADQEYQAFVEKYGKDNADYLMAVMGAWKKHYQRAVYIDMGIGDNSKVKAKAQSQAAERGWSFEEINGNMDLIRRLLEGTWMNNQDNDFLVVQPGQNIFMTFDENIIGCKLL